MPACLSFPLTWYISSFTKLSLVASLQSGRKERMHRHYFTNKNKLLTCSIHLMWKLGISFDGQTMEWTYIHWLVKENGQCLVSISLQIQPLNCLEEFKRSKAEVILLSSLLWAEVSAHQSNRASCSKTSPPFLSMDLEQRAERRWEVTGSAGRKGGPDPLESVCFSHPADA